MKKIFLYIILIIILLIVVLQIWQVFNLNQQQVAVLVYHNIVLDENGKDSDTLTIAEFEEQLKYLKDNGYNTISVEDFYAWKEEGKPIPKKSVVITFDDGYASFKYLAQPILEKYEFKAICFLIGMNTTKDTKENGTIGIDEIKNHNENITYGSHTFGMHKADNQGNPIVKNKTYNEIEQDIEEFKNKIFDAKYLAYPYYTYTKDFVKVLEDKDYKLAFAGEEEMVVRSANNYKVPRISAVKDIDEFKNIFETNKYKNKYGNGLTRKVYKVLSRKLGINL